MFFYTQLFGETKQLGKVLATSFKGKHRWIPSDDRSLPKIDAMFFAHTEEPVVDSDRYS